MDLIILGAGGHGQVVADIARQMKKYDSVQFLDDNSDLAIGPCSDFVKYKFADVEMYPAFGNNVARVEWEMKLLKEGISLATIIHPLAYISPNAHISAGSVFMPYSVVNTGCEIGMACIINCSAILDHHCILEDGCHIAPGAIVKGGNHLPPFTKVDSGEVIERDSLK